MFGDDRRAAVVAQSGADVRGSVEDIGGACGPATRVMEMYLRVMVTSNGDVLRSNGYE